MSKIFQDYYLSPLGTIQITVVDNAITSLNFVEDVGISSSHPLIDSCKKQLNEYFSNNLRIFTLPLHPMGTPFQQKVWKTLEEISYGQVVSYKEIAIQMGCPSSIRAVANAIAKNPIFILIPCHRVIGSNGSLTGFAAGISRKKKLLELEKEQ